MSAINPDKLSKFQGEFYLRKEGETGSFTRLASVRGLVANIDNTANQVEVKADDTGTVFKGYTPTANITFEFLENADRDIISMLFGGTTSDVAATPVAVTDEEIVLNSSVVEFLANANGDKSKVSSVVVKNAAGTVTHSEGTDYEVVVVNGETGIVLIDGGAITAGNTVKVSYSYTANESNKVSISLDFTEKENFECKIVCEHPTDENKTRTISLSSATFDSTYNLNFANVVQAGDITGAAMTFVGNEGSLIEFEDQFI